MRLNVSGKSSTVPDAEIRFQGVEEPRRVAEPAFPRSRREASQGAVRQTRPLVRGKGGQPSQTPHDGILGDRRHHPAAIEFPAGVRPRRLRFKWRVDAVIVFDRLSESAPNPLRYWNRHCVPQEPPALSAGVLLQDRSPTRGEALEPFYRLYRRRDNPAGRQKDRRRRRYRQRRTRFQGRNGVDRQPVPHAAFRPVEANGPRTHRSRHIDSVGPLRWRIVSQQYLPGVSCLTRDDEHSPTALGKTEGPGVYHTVRPPVVQLLKSPQNRIDGLASLQMQHEVHVLDDDPRYGSTFKQAEKAVYDGALPAVVQTGLVASHRQVLAREPGGHDLSVVGQASEDCHIGMKTGLRPPPAKDTRGVLALIAEQRGPMTRSLKPQLKAANAGEQS